MRDVATLQFTKKQHQFIKKAAKRYSLSMGELAYQCTYYVYKHRYDPYQMEEIIITSEIKKMDDKMVGFIRTQERKHILPMHEKVIEIQKQMIAFNSLMQQLIVNQADVDISETSETKEFKPVIEQDYSQEIERLKRSLVAKEEHLLNFRKSLEAIKNASMPKRGEVLLRLDEQTFNELVSLV